MVKYPLEGESQSLRRRKHLLREKIKKLIKNISEEEKKKESYIIQKKLEALAYFRKAKVIMFYWALPGEPDLKDLIRKVKQGKKIVALPLIKGRDIKAYRFTSSKDLRKNRLGFLQPKEETSREIPLKNIDVVLVPGLAFDKKNRRLGRGKGYYDRFLKKLPPETIKIGIAFNCQFLNYLPSALQDERVDLVISG